MQTTTPRSSPPSQDARWTWSWPQRRVIVVLLFGLLGLLTYRYLANPVYVPAELPEAGPRSGELPGRLDPNVAPWGHLSLLPGIGEKKAKAIVDYRERSQAERPGELVFQRPEDLTHVPGIGEATLANLEPYLQFPSDLASEPDSKP